MHRKTVATLILATALALCVATSAPAQGVQNGSLREFRSATVASTAATVFPSVSAPTVTVTKTCAGTCATTWGYKVEALFPDGTHTAASTEATTTANAATLDATHYNTLTWTAVSGASSYKVYRTTAGTTPSSTGLLGTVYPASGLVFVDNAVAAVTATPSTASTATAVAPFSGVYIKNDGAVSVYIKFGSGSVDTTAGVGGGILAAGEGAWFPVKASLLSLQTASSTAAVRVWVYQP